MEILAQKIYGVNVEVVKRIAIFILEPLEIRVRQDAQEKSESPALGNKMIKSIIDSFLPTNTSA